MKGFAGRSAAPGIKILEIQQKCTRNDINENYVKDRKYVRKYIQKEYTTICTINHFNISGALFSRRRSKKCNI